MYIATKWNYFYHNDPAGILFFGKIFEMAHACYEDWAKENQLTEVIFNDRVYAFPIIHSSADYKKPLFSCQEYRVIMQVPELRESSYQLEFTFQNGEGETLAVVETVHVCIARTSMLKTPLPGELRDCLQDI
ncbi:MAG: acyl-CoA thioesterase [Ignavibacteria bacterium]|nr:acyl-CoA thioesterase [Ignavibacteria bacterium]